MSVGWFGRFDCLLVVGWLSVGWLVDWLVAWLVGWLGGCLLDWLFGWCVGWFVVLCLFGPCSSWKRASGRGLGDLGRPLVPRNHLQKGGWEAKWVPERPPGTPEVASEDLTRSQRLKRRFLTSLLSTLGGGKVPGVPHKPIEKRGRQTTHFLH